MSSAMSAFNTLELTQSPSAECRWLRRVNEREIPLALRERFWREGLFSPGIPPASQRVNFPEADSWPAWLSVLNFGIARHTSKCEPRL